MLNNTTIKKNGFTIIELLVVISIIGITSTLILNFVIISFKATRFEVEQAEAVKQARDGMNTMKTEIRGANNSAQGEYPLLTTRNQEFTFFSDIDKDDVYEKVRYYLSGRNLRKEITKPGLLNDYTGSTTASIVSEYVNNQNEDIFSYYNSDYSTTTNINLIRLININLKINVTPEIAPADIYVETDVTLRNLKSNL